jgi:prepilin-type N-terminal cleavage/methylation domain-containing protein
VLIFILYRIRIYAMPRISNLPSCGFTLVELLIVISFVGILSALTLSMINAPVQRRRAEDGVKLANITRLAQGIESYMAAEGLYPPYGVPPTGQPARPNMNLLGTYLTHWPNNEPEGATYVYWVAPDLRSAGMSVTKSSNENFMFKYRSEWGRVDDCHIVSGLDNTLCVTVLPPGPDPEPLPDPDPKPDPIPIPGPGPKPTPGPGTDPDPIPIPGDPTNKEI